MTTKHDWTIAEIQAIFEQPFMDLLFQAHTIHRQHFDVNNLQISTLLSIKSGKCPEDCAYCPQSAHYKTNTEKHQLLDIETIIENAKKAKALGASRFCMGAAWRNPPKNEFPKILEIVKAVKALGLETCMTLGMLSEEQANQLGEAGLDFYNHNIDTSKEYYDKIITTRTFQDRLDTLALVRAAGINTCCGGIMGLGESRADRFSFLQSLANLPEHPLSVPINHLNAFEGTPLAHAERVDPFEFVRVIASARILMPKSVVRFACGRNDMNDELHALCFFAGANSIFCGEKYLMSENSKFDRDEHLLQRLNLKMSHDVCKASSSA